ncbi:hypothetical protein [Amycolatopsis sp. lyj-112]|uniref:hypothetical protein n=1 Tax=Amycolatopsis sp. lyj-112 TaxID=2789288 RepID=UPI0039789AC8
MTDDARPATSNTLVSTTGRRLRELTPTAMWMTAVVITIFTAGVVTVLWWSATAGLNGVELVNARLNTLKIGLSIGVGSGGVVALYLAWRRQHSAEATLAHQQADAAAVRTTSVSPTTLVPTRSSAGSQSCISKPAKGSTPGTDTRLTSVAYR